MNKLNTSFSLRLSPSLHDAIKKNSVGSISKTVNSVLMNATIDDVVSAIIRRYEADDVPDDAIKSTSVLVSESTRQNVDVISIKTSIPRDTVVRLMLENYFVNLPTTKQNP